MHIQAENGERVLRVVGVLVVAATIFVLAGCERAGDPLAGVEFGEVEGQEAIVFDNGETFVIEPDRFRGVVGPITVLMPAVYVRGWAVNVEAREGATEVLLFSGGKLVGRGIPDVERESVHKHLGMELTHPVGFSIVMPSDVMVGLEQPLEVYALHDRGGQGFAGKLRVPERSRCLLERLPIDSAECD